MDRTELLAEGLSKILHNAARNGALADRDWTQASGVERNNRNAYLEGIAEQSALLTAAIAEQNQRRITRPGKSDPMIAAPLRYHGPGWHIDLPDGFDAILWAPKSDGTRDSWSASWRNPDGSDGDYASGFSLAEAFNAFDTYPDPVQAALIRETFREVTR